MIYKKYYDYVNEQKEAELDTEINSKIDTIRKDMTQTIFNSQVKYSLRISLDGFNVKEGNSYYTIYEYKGNDKFTDKKYKNKKVVYKIKINKIYDLKKEAGLKYPKWVWNYDVVASQVLGDVTAKKYSIDYEKKGGGISGRYLIANLNAIKNLTDDELILNEINNKVIKNYILGKTSRDFEEEKTTQSEAEPEKKAVVTEPKSKEEVKKEIETGIESHPKKEKSKEDIKKEQEAIVKKNLEDNKNIVTKQSPKEVQKQKQELWKEKEKKEAEPKKVAAQKTQTQIQQGTQHTKEKPVVNKKVTKKRYKQNTEKTI